jgi:aerobic-type carbon monoxide dehydrogenase small subunit (CoxS/CutS family)
MKLALTVNGRELTAEVAPLARLLDVLRESLALTGTKEGCGEGECGACSVILDGQLVNSCLVPACQAQGAQVLTVEGVARPDPLGEQLAPLQRCLVEKGGAQCGICTPGMVMAAHCFLESGAAPTDEAVREALAGNLCRCTGYQKIVESVILAAERGEVAT